MYKPTRDAAHSIDPTLSDLIHEAHRDDRPVELVATDRGLTVRIDGVDVAPIPSESFDWPLHRIDMSDDAAALAADSLDRRRKRRFERRKRKLRTDDHAASEGATVL
ncbi:hypothetical protein NDI85_20020 [Halomicroarcula sp. S1AR25-4]|uniref:hypothetical protein n=1 Tax=Haloarcula sp. S1AR25-4 TaxID=2950538 RepID=UPI0028740F85|nr:hypothetical protein [Halomicroarcula sp. S1AR25-4]MDS0280076.1 hypothetical protein [Halomicroarcula sp. S1AR25-4]